MSRLLSTAAGLVIAAALTAVTVVLITGTAGVGAAEAADENANGQGLGAVLREQKAINRRLRAAILRANRANKDTAANKSAIDSFSAIQGAQGPQGPTGSPGAPGAQGPAGVADLEIVTGDVRTLAPGTQVVARVACPAGKRVMAGGYQQTDMNGGGLIPPAAADRLTIASTLKNPQAEEWAVAARNYTAVTTQYFIVYATCAAVAA